MSVFDIMVDIDDVLFPLAPQLHQRAFEMGLHDGTKEALEVWHGHEQYGCTREAWWEVFDSLAAEGAYLHTPPDEEAVRRLRGLYFSGHRIWLVTARGFMGRAEEIRQWTTDWVFEWGIPHTALKFARDKVAAQEPLGVEFDYAIDDGAHNFEILREAGISAYLQDRPHNREVDTDFRVQTFGEFADIIEEAA